MKKFIVYTIMLMSSFFVHAQEFIKNLGYIKFEESIIRTVDAHRQMVYFLTEGKCSFCMVTDGMSTLDMLTIEHVGYKINDFEVFEGKVYFCWVSTNVSSQHSLFGVFDIATFPYSNVSTYEYGGLTSYNKMDLYKAEGEVHVVIIGYNHDDPKLVDSRELSSGLWGVSLGIPYFDGYQFDDVAVVDRHVVVSGHKVSQGFPSIAVLWYIARAVNAGTYMFPSAAIRNSLYYGHSPMLLAKSGGRLFTIMSPSMLYDGLSVGVYDDTFLQGSAFDVLFPSGYAQYSEFMDVKYNPDSRWIDALFQYGLMQNRSSSVLHVDIITAPYSTTSVIGHDFQRHLLQSLDFFPVNAGVVRATGVLTNDVCLQQYSHKYNAWGNCTQEVGTETKMNACQGNRTDEFSSYLQSFWLWDVNTSVSFPNVTIWCGAEGE